MIPEPPRNFGLRDVLEDDFITVFAERAEFACWKEFEIITYPVATPYGGKKITHIFADSVVWDTETLKKRMIVQQQGVYLGTVLLFILKKWFATEPKAEEILWERIDRGGGKVVKQGWRILDIVDAEYVYEISLDALRA
jgi:hypothetical protein